MNSDLDLSESIQIKEVWKKSNLKFLLANFSNYGYVKWKKFLGKHSSKSMF